MPVLSPKRLKIVDQAEMVKERKPPHERRSSSAAGECGPDTRTRTHIRMYTYMRTQVHTHMRTHVRARTHTGAHARVHAHTLDD